MTAQEAKKQQSDLAAKGYKLGWWFGTRCAKCCGVYPRFKTTDDMRGYCYYKCDVCGRESGRHDMPWEAEEDWNNSDAQLFLEV